MFTRRHRIKPHERTGSKRALDREEDRNPRNDWLRGRDDKKGNNEEEEPRLGLKTPRIVDVENSGVLTHYEKSDWYHPRP